MQAGLATANLDNNLWIPSDIGHRHFQNNYMDLIMWMVGDCQSKEHV
jgi:hypothetical protein